MVFMGRSRSKNTVLKIFTGFAAQAGIILLFFIGRKVFLRYLAVEYLGVYESYSNILTLLSAAELGLGNIMMYTLYKPIADGDRPMIRALFGYFGRIYAFAAVSAVVIGAAFIPFLGLLIKDSPFAYRDLAGYYLLFLANTVAGYFAARKAAFIAANQEMRVQRAVLLSVSAFQQLLYIAVLVAGAVFAGGGNYYFYTAVTVFCTLLGNFILGRVCDIKYPYLKNPGTERRAADFDRKPIIRNVISTFIYKFGVIAVGNTDNILITVIIGAAAAIPYGFVFMLLKGFLYLTVCAAVFYLFERKSDSFIKLRETALYALFRAN